MFWGVECAVEQVMQVCDTLFGNTIWSVIQIFEQVHYQLGKLIQATRILLIQSIQTFTLRPFMLQNPRSLNLRRPRVTTHQIMLG